MKAGRTCLSCVLAMLGTLNVNAQVSVSVGVPAATAAVKSTSQNGTEPVENRNNGLATPKWKTEPQLPDAPSDQIRLTAKQKFETFARRTYSPYTFASAAFNATWAQMLGDWYGYGGGMQGWGKRFGASLANTETRMMFSSFLLPVVFHQDPRYHPSKKHGLFPRAWYAGTRVLITRGDYGEKMFNYSEVLGVLFTASVQNAYYPRRDRGFGDTMQRFVGGFSSDTTSNLLREFSPEIKRIAKKIIPKRAKKLQQRLPDPVKDLGGHAIP